VAIVLGYLFAIPLPNALGIDLRWGVAGLTLAAGLGGWAEFILLRRKLNRRIGPTGLSASFIIKLWAVALVAAGVAWALKVLVGVSRPILSAIVILGSYGVLYFALTSLLSIPEAQNIVRRFTKIFGRRGR
jgi:putative peptidoglycan lipid II flippase